MNNTDLRELQQLLRDQAPAVIADWRQRLAARPHQYRLELTPETELRAEMAALLEALAATAHSADSSFDTDEAHATAQSLRQASQVRAARGFSPEESLLFLQTCRQALWATLRAKAEPSMGVLQRVDELMDRCALLQLSAFVSARDEATRRQTEALRELSTPVITLWDSMLLLPLVGVVDSVRAQQISERLLEAIGQTEAEVTLIDVTGVPVMDTGVARHILKTVAAAQMLGTRVVLTGISPTTAQTMVKLGIDLSSVPTRGTLKAGVALAMSLTGRTVVVGHSTHDRS